MLIKQVQFQGLEKRGSSFIVNCLPLIDRPLIKTAEAAPLNDAIAQMRSKLHPQVQDFVSNIIPSSAGIYVLVNALGAGEYWGSNVNGDLFPEKALIHAPPNWEQLSAEQMRQVGAGWKFGFPTFMKAHPYKHHVNKDPSRAFGRVEVAVWNPEMKRVELVIYLDRALCMQFDALDLIERIERGGFPDVSMGCRVPFDVCTICENPAKTRADYCMHALTMMNKILPDGRKVAVRNDNPDFFDISFVTIGADKTAKVMAKLAQRGSMVCMGDFCSVPRLSVDVGAMFSKQASFMTSPEMVKVANDPIKVRYEIQGVPIWVEWKKGETRIYKNKKGETKYERLMKADYGYIPETKDCDGEEIDVYVGPDLDSKNAYVIRQLKKNTGKFDENKVMVGYDSAEDARKSYDYHMGGTVEFFGGMEKVPVSALRVLFGENGNGKEKVKTASGDCDCHGLGDDCGGTVEGLCEELFPGSREKSSSQRKLSELIKSIPAGPFTRETLPRLESAEPNIPNDVLDSMGSLPLSQSLSTPAMAGMVLKPHEFQRLILVSMGEKPYADELEGQGMTFGHTNEVDESIPVGSEHVQPQLLELLSLLGLVRGRSAAAPALRARAAQASGTAPAQPSVPAQNDPLMQKVAAAYNGYRRSIVKKANQIQQYMTTDPQLLADLFGGSMAQAFAGGVEKVATSVFGPDSLAYLVGAYTDRDMHLASNEVIASLALTGAVTEAA